MIQLRRIDRTLAKVEREIVYLREIIHGASTVEIEHGEPWWPMDKRRAKRADTAVRRIKQLLDNVLLDAQAEVKEDRG